MIPSWAQRWGIPTPFPVGDVNAWYLPGRVPSLVDPGPKTADAWTALEAHLSRHPVKRIVFTHHHVDHSGLAARLQRDYGVEVAAHPKEAAILDRWGERRDERVVDYRAGLTLAGVPKEIQLEMKYGGDRIEALGEHVRPDIEVDEEDALDLGDRAFEVLHCPGHTAGSILLRAPDKSATFSGDTLLERITPNALSVRASERRALIDYLATLRRLRGERLGVILPGHQGVFDDATSVIDAALRHADARQARLLRLLGEAPGTGFELTNRLFLRLPKDQVFLAISETLGHLEALRVQGRVRAARDGEAERFEAARV